MEIEVVVDAEDVVNGELYAISNTQSFSLLSLHTWEPFHNMLFIFSFLLL